MKKILSLCSHSFFLHNLLFSVGSKKIFAINSLHCDIVSIFCSGFIDLSKRFLFRRLILNSERAKRLWTDVDFREILFTVSRWRFYLLFKGLGKTLCSLLYCLPLKVLTKAVDALQICLNNFNTRWHISVHFPI